jgi:RNA polymerase sigma-70 factor (ECF subfamily)
VKHFGGDTPQKGRDDEVLPQAQKASTRMADAAPPAARDKPTFARLYRDHVQQVARWAARLGGPALEVEDVVQEVFMIAHRQLEKFRGDSLVSTWLFSITHNVVRHRRRKENLRRFLLVAAQGESRDRPLRPTPVEELERREATSTVYRALDGLREKYRTVFILFEIEGLSGPEIAELTGLSPATLRVRLFRARAQFAERLRGLVSERSARRGEA